MHTGNLFDIITSCEKQGVDVVKAYMNTFANGVTVYTIFSNDDVPEKQWSEVEKTCNLVLNLPDFTFVHPYFKYGLYSA